jgi:hypothetical protein
MTGALRVEQVGATPCAMAIGLHTSLPFVPKELRAPMFGIKQIPSLFRLASTQGSVGLTPAWSVAPPQRLRRAAEERVTAPAAIAGDECTCGFALAGHGAAYNQEAFRFLLDIERKRFEASGEPFVLLLIDHRDRRAGSGINSAIGAGVFASLTGSLRDTDVIGWYRQGRVIGAVLTHLGDAPVVDVSRQMADRVTRALASDLPNELARQLRVRVYQPQARQMN